MRSVGAMAFVLVFGGRLVTACSGDTFEATPVGAGAGGGAAGAGGSAGQRQAAGSGGSAGGRAGSSAGGSGATAGASGSTAAGGAGASGGGSAGGSAGNGGQSGEGGGGAAGFGGASEAAGSGGESGQGGGAAKPPFVVSNAALVGAFDPQAVTQISFASSFDTDTDCASTKLGACQEIAAPAEGLPLCVCRGAIYDLGNATITGSRGLVILATQAIKITGTVTVLAGGTEADGDAPEGSGGSFATEGGGASAAKVRGEETLQPLLAGQRGAGVCGVSGGQGGGALQLSAGATLEVATGGVIQAGGRAAAGAPKKCAGSGGGSGGAILLEATTLNIIGVVAANGASGSGGGSFNVVGGAGRDGLPAETAAPGGAGSNDNCLGASLGGGRGGDGAALISLAKPGGAGNTACLSTGAPGGGGGGRGRVRLRYRNFQQAGVVSPKPSQITLPAD